MSPFIPPVSRRTSKAVRHLSQHDVAERTFAEIAREKEAPIRAFVCTTLNPFGYPAKDRSGRLATIEEPHLGRLMEKIRRPLTAPPTAQFQVTLPAEEPAATTTTATQEG